MQRNFWVARMLSIALVPWLNGRILHARRWVRAPEFINGVPLQSGQKTLRRFTNANSQARVLNAMQQSMIKPAVWLGWITTHTRAVAAPIKPRQKSEKKNTAIRNGRALGSERARCILAICC